MKAVWFGPATRMWTHIIPNDATLFQRMALIGGEHAMSEMCRTILPSAGCMCGTYRFHQLVTTTLMIPAGIRWGLHLAGGTMPYTLYDCACGLAAAWHRWPTFEGDALIVEDDTFWLPYGPDAVPNLEELRQLRTTLVETMIAMARGRAASGDDYGQDEADGAACRAMANALRAARKDTP